VSEGFAKKYAFTFPRNIVVEGMIFPLRLLNCTV